MAPGTQLAGDAGLLAVLEQLQGFEAAAGAWESELFARRLRHYEPGWLDRLCHAGEVAWLRLTPRAARRRRSAPATATPSKATPIAVVLRSDLGWLLAASGAARMRSARRSGATAEIVETLQERGASFASDLAVRTRRLPDDIERGLWDGVARGLLMCDGFAAIRSEVRAGRAAPPPSRAVRFSRLRRAGMATEGSAGRWSLVPQPEADPDVDRHDLAEAVAEQLLNRWGVLFRDLAVHDGLRLPWREVQWALRRLEDRGLVRGGRFVAGFSGEQYALPEAVEQLARVRKAPKTGERVVVNATDPLNLVGLSCPGDTVPAVRTNRIVYVDGIPEARAVPA